MAKKKKREKNKKGERECRSKLLRRNIEFLIWKKKKKTFDSKMINVNLKF